MKDQHLTIHHMFSKSRYPAFADKPWNQVEVEQYKHRLHHFLWGNMNPYEILERLYSGFQFDPSDCARWNAWKKLYGIEGPEVVAEIILGEWTPKH